MTIRFALLFGIDDCPSHPPQLSQGHVWSGLVGTSPLRPLKMPNLTPRGLLHSLELSMRYLLHQSAHVLKFQKSCGWVCWALSLLINYSAQNGSEFRFRDRCFFCRRGVETIMVCSRLHNMRFFLDTIELQVIRKGCITVTTNTKPLAIRDFIAGTC